MHDPIRSVGGMPGGRTDLRLIEQSFTDLGGSLHCSLDEAADEVLAFQRANVEVYARFCSALPGFDRPHIPIEVFKHVPVIAGDASNAEAVFISSGTGSRGRSRHYVRKLSVYEQSYTAHFRSLFGEGPFTMAAHLPQYHREGASSSLVRMVRGLMDRFGDAHSVFFLEDTRPLTAAIERSHAGKTAFLLFGAAFGLLDLTERGRWKLPAGAIIIETGGMKTRRREIDRNTLHNLLADGFDVDRSRIWSEYGMCELLSQCYSRPGDVFLPPPWVEFQIRALENPLQPVPPGTPGLLAVLDLANMYSVSAILTEDLAVADGPGFRLLGRVEGSELRGCNLLVEQLLTS